MTESSRWVNYQCFALSGAPLVFSLSSLPLYGFHQVFDSQQRYAVLRLKLHKEKPSPHTRRYRYSCHHCDFFSWVGYICETLALESTAFGESKVIMEPFQRRDIKVTLRQRDCDSYRQWLNSRAEEMTGTTLFETVTVAGYLLFSDGSVDTQGMTQAVRVPLSLIVFFLATPNKPQAALLDDWRAHLMFSEGKAY